MSSGRQAESRRDESVVPLDIQGPLAPPAGGSKRAVSCQTGTENERRALEATEALLNFEAIIGTDILEQTSLKFTEEGVEFHKYEVKNYQDQKESIRPEAKGSIQEIKSENI
ncbi:hypothetical protein NPIL_551241 [Nephila pilipes]|uniref:Uncharacterized protein n=1 Tax=Nephila pilipes TaxID=299642 RepID=A0A8X6JQ64_NEPPI|nr:hypothetical protein NPIL_551241 [Nephila pilipes]